MSAEAKDGPTNGGLRRGDGAKGLSEGFDGTYSVACGLTSPGACPVTSVVLRFTTLSDGQEQSSFR
jgi:hypothetical protein